MTAHERLGPGSARSAAESRKVHNQNHVSKRKPNWNCRRPQEKSRRALTLQAIFANGVRDQERRRPVVSLAYLECLARPLDDEATS
jgi:hypothetical protein